MFGYLKILKKLISINSSSGVSNKEITDYIESLFKRKKDFFDIKVQPIKKKNFWVYNLIVVAKGKTRENPLIFAGHTDTVPPGEEWKTPPFRAVLRNNRLYGLGASDMKGAISLMIYNLLNLKFCPENDVYLILSADEESEGEGIKRINSFLKQKKVKNAKIIVGESTSGKLRLGQKAILGFRVEIHNRGGHSAKISLLENLKQNPIQRMLRVVEALNDFAKKIDVGGSKKYGGVTFNVGKFIAGESSNSLPSKAVSEMEFRFPPKKEFKDFERLKKQILKEIKKIEPSAKIKIFFEGGFFETSAQNQFVLEIQSIARRLFRKPLDVYFDTPWTEASIYKEFGDVVILGPGKIGQPHTENEYIELKTLEKVNKIYSTILNRYASTSY